MASLWQKYKLRLRRRYLIARAFYARFHLSCISLKNDGLSSKDIACFVCGRNEYERLPHFLAHHRAIGVKHFYFIDNDSNDGTTQYLKKQKDVSLWHTAHSYKKSRFGVDWVHYLLSKYGNNKWCLILDVDEIFAYPYMNTHDLYDLCQHLETQKKQAFGTLLLDLYTQGPLNSYSFQHGDDPLDTLKYFDSAPYRATRQEPKNNLWVQGGVRERVFFPTTPEKGPTLNKLPLIKWHWRYTYINSTHSLLPRHLNDEYNGPNTNECSGVLLHTKFLPSIIDKSLEELKRKQHFGKPDDFVDYYSNIAQNPALYSPNSKELHSWETLEELGLMNKGAWMP